MKDVIDVALLVLHRALEECVHAKCTVSLDFEEQLYRVSFNEHDTNRPFGELLISRTSDVLEILRRPDVECEPVIVNEKRLIWNRFRDITYENIGLIRPWVVREDPFQGLPLDLPPTAHDLLNASKDLDMILELYHDSSTCPLKHISLEMIRLAQRRAQSYGERHIFRFASDFAGPDEVSNEPGTHHGSCWKIHIDIPHALPSELKRLMEVRFTDAQITSFLRGQELVYWSEDRQEWATHTFMIVLREACITEAQESWHLRTLLQEVTGKSYDPLFPGVYLRTPDRWRPFFTIEPEYVVVGLVEKDTGQKQKTVVREENVALWDADDVRDLLEREMMRFLKKNGISADRRLIAAIQSGIKVAMDISGVDEDGTVVEFEKVKITQDASGGNVLYVVLQSTHETHEIPVTEYLHNYKGVGRVRKHEFVEEVTGRLEEFNLNEEDMKRAVSECVSLMRREKLIKR
jgi:hypothetical protein